MSNYNDVRILSILFVLAACFDPEPAGDGLPLDTESGGLVDGDGDGDGETGDGRDAGMVQHVDGDGSSGDGDGEPVAGYCCNCDPVLRGGPPSCSPSSLIDCDGDVWCADQADCYVLCL